MSVVPGTATPGGGFPVHGDAVAATLNEVDPSLAVTTRNTRGSTAANTLVAAPSRELIHPGVLRLLREIGLA